MSYYGCINEPVLDAIAAIIGKPIPVNLSEDELHDFVTHNANPHWATGDSIIEAAELIVQRAKENDNIDGYNK